MFVLKKGDTFIICLVTAAFVASVGLAVGFSRQGSRVTIKQDNKVVYSESINKNKTISTDTNTIVIKDGVVYMDNANCKNQICVKSGKISKKGESIVCLPNKTIVEIE